MSKAHWWCGIFKEWHLKPCQHSLCREIREAGYTGKDWIRFF